MRVLILFKGNAMILCSRGRYRAYIFKIFVTVYIENMLLNEGRRFMLSQEVEEKIILKV